MRNSLCIATHRLCFSSVGTATELIAGSSDFDAWWEEYIFSFLHMSRPALESSQPTIKPVPWLLFFGCKTAGLGVDHRHRSSTELMNEWSYTFTPPSLSSWHVTGRFLISLYCHTFFSWLCYLVLGLNIERFPSCFPNKLLLRFLSISLVLCVTHNVLIEIN